MTAVKSSQSDGGKNNFYRHVVIFKISTDDRSDVKEDIYAGILISMLERRAVISICLPVKHGHNLSIHS